MHAPLNRLVSLFVALMAMVAMSALAGPISVPFTETFDDAVSDLTKTETPASGTASVTITGGEVVFALDGDGTGHPVASLSGSVAGGLLNIFSISAKTASNNTGVTDIDSTNSAWGIFAGASNAETNGLALRLKNDGFTSNLYNLELFNGTTILDTVALGNLSGSYDVHEGVLSLNGSFNLDGSLSLVGTFTDSLPGSGGDNSGTVMATVAAVDVPGGELFGLRAQMVSNNQLRVRFDDLEIDVIPEPSTLLLALAGLLYVLFRRRLA